MITKANFAGKEYKSFKDLYMDAGGKYFASFYNWIVIFCLYGSTLSCQIIIASILQIISV